LRELRSAWNESFKEEESGSARGSGRGRRQRE
jgi:hypothetical protein